MFLYISIRIIKLLQYISYELYMSSQFVFPNGGNDFLIAYITFISKLETVF